MNSSKRSEGRKATEQGRSSKAAPKINLAAAVRQLSAWYKLRQISIFLVSTLCVACEVVALRPSVAPSVANSGIAQHGGERMNNYEEFEKQQEEFERELAENPDLYLFDDVGRECLESVGYFDEFENYDDDI